MQERENPGLRGGWKGSREAILDSRTLQEEIRGLCLNALIAFILNKLDNHPDQVNSHQRSSSHVSGCSCEESLMYLPLKKG